MTTDTDSRFDSARVPETLEEAIKDPDIFTGRTGNGIVTIGLFGGYGYTDDPSEVTTEDENGRGIGIARKTFEFAKQTEFTGKIQFPTVIQSEPLYGRSSMEKPFTSYRFDFYVAPDENGHLITNPLYTSIAEKFQEELDDGKTNIRAIEFNRDQFTLGERFRAVYPWGKYSNEFGDEVDVEFPDPIYNSVRTLQRHPELPEFYPVTITLYAYSTSYDKYDSVDDTFKSDFFGDGQWQHMLDASESSTEREHLKAIETREERLNLSYRLSFTVERERLEEAVETNKSPHHFIDDADDYARWLASEHYVEEYDGECRDVSVGVEKKDETEEDITFSVLITTKR